MTAAEIIDVQSEIIDLQNRLIKRLAMSAWQADALDTELARIENLKSQIEAKL